MKIADTVLCNKMFFSLKIHIGKNFAQIMVLVQYILLNSFQAFLSKLFWIATQDLL